MAKLLVYDKDNFHADPDKEYRGSYKKGYIVEVFEDSKPHDRQGHGDPEGARRSATESRANYMPKENVS